MKSGYLSVSGTMGRDPDVKTYVDRNGKNREFLTFSLAVNVRKTGDDYVTVWFGVTVFNDRLAKGVLNFLQKGDRITVNGTLSAYLNKDKKGIPTIIAESIGQSVFLTKKMEEEMEEDGILEKGKDEEDGEPPF